MGGTCIGREWEGLREEESDGDLHRKRVGGAYR